MDNHTNFNVTMFTREGDLLAAVQSDFKHNQCYDACVTPSGYVVVSTRDHKIHVYSLPSYFSKLLSDTPSFTGPLPPGHNGSSDDHSGQSPYNQPMPPPDDFFLPPSSLDQASLGARQQQMLNALELQTSLSQLAGVSQWSNLNSPLGLNTPFKWQTPFNNVALSNSISDSNTFNNNVFNTKSPNNNNNIPNSNNSYRNISSNTSAYNDADLLSALLARQLFSQQPNDQSLRDLTTPLPIDLLSQQTSLYPTLNTQPPFLLNPEVAYDPTITHSSQTFSPFQTIPTACPGVSDKLFQNGFPSHDGPSPSQ